MLEAIGAQLSVHGLTGLQLALLAHAAGRSSASVAEASRATGRRIGHCVAHTLVERGYLATGRPPAGSKAAHHPAAVAYTATEAGRAALRAIAAAGRDAVHKVRTATRASGDHQRQ